MAKTRRSTRSSVESPVGKENGIVLHFNKNCEVGKIINEHLLPDNFKENTLEKVLSSCIDHLLCANIDSYKFSTSLIRSVGAVAGTYREIEVKDRSHLRTMLRKLCRACGACENFIGEEKIEKCPMCDDDDESSSNDKDVDEPLMKKVSLFPP